jgi:serine protease AprX
VLFRGSGTSQAAAVVSGAVALVIQQHPTFTPDQIKKVMLNGPVPLDKEPHEAMGKGQLNLAAVFKAPNPDTKPQAFTYGSGAGSLELSRGTIHLAADGVALSGELDIFGNRYDAALAARNRTNDAAWVAGLWNGFAWSGDAWADTTVSDPLTSRSWTSRSWTSRSWTSRSWTGADWLSRSWSSRSWTGAGWTAGSWGAGGMSPDGWTGDTWSSAAWW